MESRDSNRRLAGANVARLATVNDEGQPHVVPIVFALEGDTLYFVVDWKPKKTTNLKRLKNIAANPAVSVLVDHYEDDWTLLWWVRADGTARVITDDAESRHAIDLLANKYPQYWHHPPAGRVVAIRIDRLTGWSGAGTFTSRSAPAAPAQPDRPETPRSGPPRREGRDRRNDHR